MTDAALQDTYRRLKVIYIAHIPSDEERRVINAYEGRENALLAWRLLLFEDRHWEMHRGSCPLAPCDCDAYLLIKKRKRKPHADPG